MRRLIPALTLAIALFAAACGGGSGGNSQASSTTSNASAKESGLQKATGGVLRTVFGPSVEGLTAPKLVDYDVGPDGAIYTILREDKGKDFKGSAKVIMIVPSGGGTPKVVARAGEGPYHPYFSPEVIAVNDRTGEFFVHDVADQALFAFDAAGNSRLVTYTGMSNGNPHPRSLPPGFPSLIAVRQIALDPANNDVYLADDYEVLRVDAAGTPTVVLETTIGADVSKKEGGPPAVIPALTLPDGSSVAIGELAGLALDDKTGDLYLADDASIYRMARDGKAVRLAGPGTVIPRPEFVDFAPDADGGVVFFYAGGNVIYRVDPDSTTTIVAGNGQSTDAPADGPAIDVALDGNDLTVGPGGKLYIGNYEPARIQVLEKGADSANGAGR